MNVIYYLAQLFANIRMDSQHVTGNDLASNSLRNTLHIDLAVDQDDVTNWLGFIITEDTVGVGGGITHER